MFSMSITFNVFLSLFVLFRLIPSCLIKPLGTFPKFGLTDLFLARHCRRWSFVRRTCSRRIFLVCLLFWTFECFILFSSGIINVVALSPKDWDSCSCGNRQIIEFCVRLSIGIFRVFLRAQTQGVVCIAYFYMLVILDFLKKCSSVRTNKVLK